MLTSYYNITSIAQARDAKGLRRLSDFLNQCQSAVTTIGKIEKFCGNYLIGSLPDGVGLCRMLRRIEAIILRQAALNCCAIAACGQTSTAPSARSEPRRVPSPVSSDGDVPHCDDVTTANADIQQQMDEMVREMATMHNLVHVMASTTAQPIAGPLTATATPIVGEWPHNMTSFSSLPLGSLVDPKVNAKIWVGSLLSWTPWSVNLLNLPFSFSILKILTPLCKCL